MLCEDCFVVLWAHVLLHAIIVQCKNISISNVLLNYKKSILILRNLGHMLFIFFGTTLTVFIFLSLHVFYLCKKTNWCNSKLSWILISSLLFKRTENIPFFNFITLYPKIKIEKFPGSCSFIFLDVQNMRKFHTQTYNTHTLVHIPTGLGSLK